MRELSIFVDESGSDGLSDRHYLLRSRRKSWCKQRKLG